MNGTSKCGVRSAECGVRSAECGVRSAECGVRSAECGSRDASLGDSGGLVGATTVIVPEVSPWMSGVLLLGVLAIGWWRERSPQSDPGKLRPASSNPSRRPVGWPAIAISRTLNWLGRRRAVPITAPGTQAHLAELAIRGPGSPGEGRPIGCGT